MSGPSDASTGNPSASLVGLSRNDYRTLGGNGSEFKAAWTFKGKAVPLILKLLDGVPHPWAHVCCGSSIIPGEDVRVDLHHPSAHVQIDAEDLDKHLGGLGAVIIDPPYGLKVWDLAKRQRVVSACFRALGAGGRFIVHAPWQPRFPKSMMTCNQVYVRDDTHQDFPMPPIILAAYDKTRNPKLSGSRDRHDKERTRRGKA